MGGDIAALSPDRKREIAQAFTAWYESQPFKKGAMARIDRRPGDAFVFRTGDRTPPPRQLLALYRETGAKVFLYTRDEKDRMARQQHWPPGHIPDAKEWPALEDTIEQPELEAKVREVVQGVKQVTVEIKGLSLLPEGSPARERARARLVGPAMELFEQLQGLNLQWPSAFEDLLRSISLARKLKPGK